MHADGQIEPADCEDGSVRLSGESAQRGRVEICRGSVWGSVCFSYGFSNRDAAVICRMLGYQPDYTLGGEFIILFAFGYTHRLDDHYHFFNVAH